MDQWQTSWNNSIGNKLLELKPTIGEHQSVVRNIRKEGVVLARLRLGHTRVTHSYLLQVKSSHNVLVATHHSLPFGMCRHNSVGNKLFEIKPVIGLSQPVVRNVRQGEIVLARLRMSHTRITHSYLLKREEPPYCFGCDALFTVRHFLLECGNFSHIRNKYFHVDTIKQLLNDVPIDNVFLSLKEINFLTNCSYFPLNCLIF